MSNPQRPVDDDAGHSTEPPPFQPFPAAAREPRPRPTSRSQAPLHEPAGPEVARSGSHHSVDDVDIRGSRHRDAAHDLMHRERQRTTALPAFTAFPSAPASSRWAPPEGARPKPPQPMPPPAFVPESARYPPFHSSEAVRYPSGAPLGQPSPYAPPGPLTARPHVCEHCETGFARAHDLRRHLETHRSERPHKCPNCQRSFSRKDAVHRHLMLTQCIGSSASSSSNQ